VNATPPNRRLVVAPSYPEFKRYVDHDADPKLIHIYIADANVLAGRSFAGDQLIYLGGWQRHKEAQKIQDRITYQLNRNGEKK
jgi:hypothetical protein